jgi:hypothetical protein
MKEEFCNAEVSIDNKENINEEKPAEGFKNFTNLLEEFISQISAYPSIFLDSKKGKFYREQAQIQKLVGKQYSIDDEFEFVESRDMQTVIRFMRQIETVNPNNERIVLSSLMISLFSCFDSFLSDLLKLCFHEKKELYNLFQNRSLNYVKIENRDTVVSIREVFLDDYIDEFHRKSYIEQIAEIEKIYKLEIRKGNEWPKFVECSQRRNIFTHCAGIASDQYIENCVKEGYSFSSEVKRGTALTIDKKYLKESCDVVIFTGIKISQLLWRKLFPQDHQKCDEALNSVIYSMLDRQNWECAKMIGQFSLEQKIKQDDCSKMIRINYAEALYYLGEKDKCSQFLNDLDFSGSALAFRLAKSVLLEDYEAAAIIMKRIGTNAEILGKDAYHSWPLFNVFRNTEIFLTHYEEIFGKKFIDDGILVMFSQKDKQIKISWKPQD